jgi:hypothetical protein
LYNGLTFEYLALKKQRNVVADALSCLDIDSLKIQENEVLTLLSGSESNSSSNIKFNSLNNYCLDLQRTSKSQELWIKRKGFHPNSLLNTTNLRI